MKSSLNENIFELVNKKEVADAKKQLFRSALWKSYSENFVKIPRKTDATEPFLEKFETSSCNSVETGSHHECFPGKTITFQSISRRLLLTVFCV